MKVITRQGQVNTVASQWEAAYNSSKPSQRPERFGAILKALKALGANPKPDDIDKIIGNTSWTAIPSCFECGTESPNFVIQLGEEPTTNESATTYLCRHCVKQLPDRVEATLNER